MKPHGGSREVVSKSGESQPTREGIPRLWLGSKRKRQKEGEAVSSELGSTELPSESHANDCTRGGALGRKSTLSY